ncbi:MAG: rRNA maturation RNase YbeY [Candidatus Paceibacterota bacterium]|jgi:rRNA maturation RNase YbeY
MNRVLVTALIKGQGRAELKVKKLALQVLKILQKKAVSLEIFLVSSQKLKHFNKEYRKKNKPANVLSFKEPREFLYPDHKKRIGEIFLNISAVSDRERLALFLVHGILHLFGYEHKTKSGRIRMEKKERQVRYKILNSNS